MSGRSSSTDLLLGEWACLGVLYPEPAHGFAIAALLAPGAEVGRIWSVSRPLTYRSLDQLTERGLVRAIGDEPGVAGPNRTILAVTRRGRTRLRAWLRTPVIHLRDLRSELLVKIVLADRCGIEIDQMLSAQRELVAQQERALSAELVEHDDVVALWRCEASRAGLRFLDELRRPPS